MWRGARARRDAGDPGFYTRAGRAFDAALRDGIPRAWRPGRRRHARGPAARLPRSSCGSGWRRGAWRPARPPAHRDRGRADRARPLRRRRAHDPAARGPEARPSRVRARVLLPRAARRPAGAVEAMRFAVSAGGSRGEHRLCGDAARRPRARARPRSRGARRPIACAARRSVLPPGPHRTRADRRGGRRPRPAAARLRRSTDRLPLTSSLVLLSEVEGALGRRGRAGRPCRAARSPDGCSRASRTLPDAEAVLFEANHGSPRRAVCARPACVERAPSIRSADALGWALTRAGRPRAGVAWARRALGRVAGSAVPAARRGRCAPLGPAWRGGALADGGGEGVGGAVAGVFAAARRRRDRDRVRLPSA